MGQVTHQQADLMLKLYDLRREPKMRQARQWFVEGCYANSLQELREKFPPTSDESTYFRMLTSYWEMCAGLVNRGLIDDELFFENNGEAWLVYDRLKHLLPEWRATFKNPTMLKQLEALSQRFEAWRERTAPGANDVIRQFLEQMRQARAKAAG